VTRTVAVVKDAGSSGATTTIVTVATLLAQRGSRVLVVDLDPQANASQWLGVVDPPASAADVLLHRATLAEAVRGANVAGVQVLAAGADLKTARIELGRVLGPELRLRRALEHAAVDVILIDCQAGAGELLPLSAIIAADAVLTVTFPGPKEIGGVPRVEGIVAEVAQAYGTSVGLAAVIPCAVPAANRGRLYGQALQSLRDSYGALVTPAVRHSVVAAEAFAATTPLPVYAPTAGVVQDYRDIVAHLQAAGVVA